MGREIRARGRRWLAVVVLSLLVFALSSRAGAADDDRAFEAALAAQLQAIDPEAVPLFAQANEARDKGDLDRAAQLYRDVGARAAGKGFSAATRRLAMIRSHQGARAEAIDLSREALRTEDSAENRSALAQALSSTRPGEERPSTSDLDEAQRHVDVAISKKPDGVEVRMTSCGIAIRRNRFPDLESCAKVLQRIAPDRAETHIYVSMVAAGTGRFDDAFASLDRARALGMPQEAYDDLRNSYRSAMPVHERYGPTALYVLAGWIAGLVVLLGIGMLLSNLTLRSVTAAPETAEGHARGSHKLLRRVYRAVLWACCAYYYVSLPIVTLLVLVIGGGIVYGTFALGHVPIKLVMVVVILTAVTVWAVLKSIFFRPKAGEPGDLLDLSAHPELRAVLDEVARRIGTRPVDHVYLTPHTDIAVFERGGVLKQLTGETERCLVLGAGVLDGFEVGAFKAVLAHEYGHFHNEDTAGGGFALAVRRSLFAMALSLAMSGAAHWYNPAWLFVSWFHKIFLRISQGASRLQEILADRWAAFAYGADAFARGMRHVIARSVRFDAHVQSALGEVIEEQRPLRNLYRYRVKGKVPDETELDRAIDEAINAEPSPYDSHPSPAQRLALIAALPARDVEASPDDAREVWDLFSDRRELERQMTNRIREAVQKNHGVLIPIGKPKKASADEDASDETTEGAPDAAAS
jgi:Zn-dependent protease with chaperone function